MTAQIPTFTRERAKDDLSVQQTTVLSTVIEKQTTQSLVVEQGMVGICPTMPLHPEADTNLRSERQFSRRETQLWSRIPRVRLIPLNAGWHEDNDVSLLQTVPIRIVQRKRAVKKIRAFFVTILLVDILFLSALAAIIVVVPSPTYKAEILMVALITFSYVASIQMKRIDRERQQTYLNAAQFVHTVKRKSAPAQAKDEERKHFKLIKQDTTAYLRALTTGDLKKGSSW
jgi:hypothetical protein